LCRDAVFQTSANNWNDKRFGKSERGVDEEFTPKKLKYHRDVRWSHVGTHVVDHEQPLTILIADLGTYKDSKRSIRPSPTSVGEANG
jgi:hypothetical protein